MSLSPWGGCWHRPDSGNERNPGFVLLARPEGVTELQLHCGVSGVRCESSCVAQESRPESDSREIWSRTGIAVSAS